MSAAAARAIAPRPSAHDVFVARCEARALLCKVGEIELLDAVDGLQQAASAYGLVAELGQDAVQKIMATAFAIMDAPERDDAASTLQAAEYLIAIGDLERFHKWLNQHSRSERMAIQQYVENKRCRLQQTK
jgi:hypothetical protein